MSRSSLFRELMRSRVLVLDGSLGVQIQRSLATAGGNVDMLNITRPDVVAAVHRSYLEAGADIIETNTFNSNAISQQEYAMESRVEELNRRGVEIARTEAQRAEELDPSRPRFVAGSMGPTPVAASLPDDVDDPAHRAVDFDTLAEAARQQSEALIRAGVDLIILETCFDALNIKAQLFGIRQSLDALQSDIPLIVSVTLSDASGRLLSGHTPEAVLAIVNEFHPDAVGFNCGAGPDSLAGHVRELALKSPFPIIFYPNAGLSDRMGNYSQTPEVFVDTVQPLLADGLLNIVGGCCGTTPGHIASLSEAARTTKPRQSGHSDSPWLAGLEAFHDDRGFINIGERCNVAGSRKFLRLIKEKNYQEALDIARRQVNDGAMMLDINLDDGMLDSVDEMTRFLRILGSDPLTSGLPWMIDSSSFEVIEAALKNVPGVPIVNSISLKHGEEQFLREARLIKSYGAAVVVMAFDEQGQADTYQRRIDVCARAYRMLTEQAGFDPRDIVFDPNVLTVATGLPEHDRYALDFIEAVRWIKQNLPGVKTSGGISNLSFAFRGNNFVRQAMHAVFLYHAIRAGLDMAIMDPGAKVTYNDIPADLLEAIESVILCRREDAADRLVEMAAQYAGNSVKPDSSEPTKRPDNVDERLADALLSGSETYLEQDLREAVPLYGTANAVVEGPLMAGMERVGKLFESGKLFLPQVVKSARVMHRAVEILKPLLERKADNQTATKGTVLLATVKGDVHDIGKNIAAVVLRCNNFNTVDLGVQVDADTIVRKAIELKPDFVGLSGLISPSLQEMANVASALRRAGLKIPLLLGGAATGELHTAVKIAPLYDGIVVRVSDAAQNPIVASRILADPEGEARKIRERYEELRLSLNQAAGKAMSSADTRIIGWNDNDIVAPKITEPVLYDAISLQDIVPYINWIYFHSCWRTPQDSAEGAKLRADADRLLSELIAYGATMRAYAAILPAYGDAEHDRIFVDGVEISTPRQDSKPGRTELLSLSDFVAPKGHNDHVGVFMVTIGDRLREAVANERDEYRRLLLQSLCDRLAEATSEWLHRQVRTRIWGYEPEGAEDLDTIRHARYRGIRPAIGYPSLPDQSLMQTLAKLVPVDKLGIQVTVNGALNPSSSVAGFYLASPQARYFTCR